MDRRVSVYTNGGKIVLEVELWDELMVLDPPGAAALVDMLHQAAVSLGIEEVVLDAKPAVISDALRLAMITRCTHLIRCFEGKEHTKAAAQIVDTLLEMLP